MSPKPLLAFDTSGPFIGLALLHSDTLLQRFEPMARGQAEALFPLAEALLAEAGLGFGDLGAVAVGRGPGNFTGIRIAVAAARGLALGRGIEAVGITGFEAIGMVHGRAGLAVIEAPRDQLYVQDLRNDTPPALWSVSDLASAEAEGAPVLPRLLASQSAPAIAAVAMQRLDAATPGPRPAPLYIRPPDAAPAKPGPRLMA